MVLVLEEKPEVIHPNEAGYTTEERAARNTSARKIQGAARIRAARNAVNHKRDHKDLPALDEHGHANPATIRFWTPFPVVHQHHHEETFFELFYDLIIVVVLMKLSYLKYDFSTYGFFTVVAIFANFWSLWSLLNVYVTMVHQEDGVHRLFYALHVMMAFVMCVAIEHPSYPFFDFGYQAFFLTMSSMISRFFSIFFWLFFLYNDKNMRTNPAMQKNLPSYSHEDVKYQVMKHAGSIFIANVIFAVTCIIEYDGDPDDSTRRRNLAVSSYSAYGSGSDDDVDEKSDHTVTIVLWLLAVAVEQVGNVHSTIYDKLPFAGEYCGERMQAWLMLCFGESVIGLLVTPLYFDEVSLKSILASFVMVFCLVTVYFDVTDADKFLHLFILRHEKQKAFWYCLGQMPFSCIVFLVGVALKTINYIEHALHDLEVASGCTHSAEHLRRLEESQLDQLASKLGSSFGDHYGLLGQHDGSEHGRRLGSMTLADYDDIAHKSFNLLCYSAMLVQIWSVLVAYAMPTDQDMKKVHMSRIGSVVIVLFTSIVPATLAPIATSCLSDYEESHRRRLGAFEEGAEGGTRGLGSSYSSYSSYGSGGDSEELEGLTMVEGLVLTALIVMISFIVSLFSIDVDRAHTYKELEEAAHHGREPELKNHAKTLEERGGVAFVAGAFGAPTKVAPAPH